MDQYNILILSAGKRVELIELFQEAAQELGIQSNIIAGDCSEYAPAIYFADKKYILPKIKEPSYIDEIIKICKQENVKLVVPTIDTDLMLLSEEKSRIFDESGATVLISDLSVVSICRDKIKTQDFFENNGFLVPKLHDINKVNIDSLKYPLFMKPKSGSSSISAFKVNSAKELKLFLNIVPNPMLQDYMTGEEYTVDVFLDFNSNVITIVPRLRMEVRSGEISKGKIVKDYEIIENIKSLMNKLKLIGHITIQLMKTKKGIEYIEINPRFGGGAPMSIRSGANSCKNLYSLLMKKHLSYNEEYEDGLIFLRYDKSICIKDGAKYK